jgi:hypothetical protein
VIATALEAVAAEFEHGSETGGGGRCCVGAGDVGDGTGELA